MLSHILISCYQYCREKMDVHRINIKDVFYFNYFFRRYYDCDEDVASDFELQNFMNEVSADGEGSEGGLGNVSLSYYNY